MDLIISQRLLEQIGNNTTLSKVGDYPPSLRYHKGDDFNSITSIKYMDYSSLLLKSLNSANTKDSSVYLSYT